jgi:hypothetical protein
MCNDWKDNERERDLLIHKAWVEGQKLAIHQRHIVSGIKSKEFKELKENILNEKYEKTFFERLCFWRK